MTLIEIINYERTLQLIDSTNVVFNVLCNTIFLISVRSTVILFGRRRISRIQAKEGNDRFEKRSLTLFSKRPIQRQCLQSSYIRASLCLCPIEQLLIIAGSPWRSVDTAFGAKRVLRRRSIDQHQQKSSIASLLSVRKRRTEDAEAVTSIYA